MSALPESLTAAALNDWYERNVGYRPQEDDPTMTDVELLALCQSVASEIEMEEPR